MAADSRPETVDHQAAGVTRAMTEMLAQSSTTYRRYYGVWVSPGRRSTATSGRASCDPFGWERVGSSPQRRWRTSFGLASQLRPADRYLHRTSDPSCARQRQRMDGPDAGSDAAA